eukprot:CAMPEP_0118635784 /NCGR_PEP_ID=MMETSP0785-20121206/2260_1 /TAXON_ID=91992 /ORGANISM="Bolidomonas pacifica, Strain CCMP 1866" /LENGTH=63 /DNA_ID=CAMNT_0006526839 /DNA_START=484 /DNA_END=672 /DNA_ORIENTATION=-
MAASLAPMYLSSISGPLTLMKLRPQAAAIEDPMRVFPHPVGPYKMPPLGCFMGEFWKILLYLT